MRLPKYVRCYDNGGQSGDRYTVVFTRLGQKKGLRGVCLYLGMNAHPTHPQGIGQHGESDKPIDRPSYAHLGKRVAFDALPADCQKVAMRTYEELWPTLNGNAYDNAH